VAPEPSAAAAALPAQPLTPVPPRAAAVILGTMITLIVLLTAILIETTWVNPASASEAPVVEQPSTVAQR
jgi:hypothetical protein